MSVLERLRQELGETELRRLIGVWRSYCASGEMTSAHVGMCIRLLAKEGGR